MHRIAPLPVVSTGPASLHQYLDQAREGERGEERYYTEDGRAASEWRTSPGLEIGGPVTALQFGNAWSPRLPLLAFGAAASRIPLSLLGLLQYLTPTLQLLCGVVVLGEPLPPQRLAGFVLVWAALVALAVDALRSTRGAVPAEATEGPQPRRLKSRHPRRPGR